MRIAAFHARSCAGSRRRKTIRVICTAVIAGSLCQAASASDFSAASPSNSPTTEPAGSPIAITAKFGKIDQRAIYGPAGVYFPERALHTGTSGVATLKCQVGQEDTLDACLLVSETPTGFDFGDTALKMAEDHAITAGATANGAKAAPGQVVLVRAPFELPR
jgi:hypothetical protein